MKIPEVVLRTQTKTIQCHSRVFIGLIFHHSKVNRFYLLLFSYSSGSHFQSPRPPRSAHFVCFSYRFRRLFYSNVSALRSGHPKIFRHDSSSKWTNMYIYKLCARCEFKLYIFTEVYNVTLVCVWRRCAAQIHEWMFWSEVNYNGFPLLRE